MKITRLYSFIFIGLFFLTAHADFALAAQTELSEQGDIQAENPESSAGLRPVLHDVDSVKPTAPPVDPVSAEDISDRKYLDKVLALIQNSKNSVYVSMYVSNPKSDSNHPVGKLFQALTEANARGVKVNIWLNSSFDEETVLDRKKFDDFWAAAEKQGLKIQWVSSGKRLHDKLIVVDREFVVEGSTNWTATAIQRNFESASLIRSRVLANAKIERLENFPIQKAEELSPLVKDFVEVPQGLFFDENLFPQMLEKNDREAWDMYFTLLFMRKAQGAGTWEIKSEDIASVIGVDPAKKSSKTRIRKVLLRLEKKYGLITFDTLKKQNAFKISLTEAVFQSDFKPVRVPVAFYQYGFQKKWPLPAQYAYCISLIMESESKARPYWMSPAYQLAERFNVDQDSLREGLTELKRENVIEFVFPKKSADQSKMSSRLLFSYKNNILRSEEEKETELLNVKNQYAGIAQDEWKRARAYAVLFDDPFDSNLNKQFVELVKVYPSQRLEPVIMRVAQFSPDNSLRSPDYIKKILEKK